jgi:hypothetical protein
MPVTFPVPKLLIQTNALGHRRNRPMRDFDHALFTALHEKSGAL